MGISRSSSSWAAFAAASKSASVFRTQALRRSENETFGGQCLMRGRERRERNTRFLPSPSSPAPSCPPSRWGLRVQAPGRKHRFCLLIFEVSPLSLFVFPTPALVALSLHPPPRKLELESKILRQESLNWNLRSSAKRAWIELESKSQLNECQSGLCWSSLQKPICLMSGFNTFVCCRRAN